MTTTLSVYPFNYEAVAFRKGQNALLTPKGKDSKFFWTSDLHFQCPIPESLQPAISQGWSVLENGTPSVFVDVIPIRTRYVTLHVAVAWSVCVSHMVASSLLYTASATVSAITWMNLCWDRESTLWMPMPYGDATMSCPPLPPPVGGPTFPCANLQSWWRQQHPTSNHHHHKRNTICPPVSGLRLNTRHGGNHVDPRTIPKQPNGLPNGSNSTCSPVSITFTFTTIPERTAIRPI